MSSVPMSTPTPQQPSITAAVLSYLVPGLGQIVQGRIGKGLLFMVCLLGMFFLGQAMGNWQNVYVPREEGRGGGVHVGPGGFASGLITRWHFGGQVWIGVAAWPAILQHFEVSMPTALRDFQKMPEETDVNRFLVNSNKSPDLGWVYTVIAGMLNILVIYDAYAGAAILRPTTKPLTAPPAEAVGGTAS